MAAAGKGKPQGRQVGQAQDPCSDAARPFLNRDIDVDGILVGVHLGLDGQVAGPMVDPACREFEGRTDAGARQGCHAGYRQRDGLAQYGLCQRHAVHVQAS